LDAPSFFSRKVVRSSPISTGSASFDSPVGNIAASFEDVRRVLEREGLA